MPMNWMHRRICKSDDWATAMRDRAMPWVLDGLDLGADVLEIGPGFGVTTKILASRVPKLTALEVDEQSVHYLQERLDPAVTVVHGDGADMPLPAARFTGAICLTMLHHVPSPEQQDRLFAEAYRTLGEDGVFCGMDSLPTLRFRVLHIGDTMVCVDPDELPSRLQAAGFTDVAVEKRDARFRFRAVKAARHNGERADL
jgi:ubiquinone/menaquinone biosynthesis C-methylase UbiE